MLGLNHKGLFIPENFDKRLLNKIFVVLTGQDLLIDNEKQNLALLDSDEIKWSGMDVVQEYFLGYLGDYSCYAAELASDSSCMEGCSFKPFRSLLGLIPDNLFTICSRSVQLTAWYNRNKYCGTCGSKTSLHPEERAMYCKKCESLFYPRISPCVIVLVTKGEELLLARNKNFPSKLFSTLAGFIEAGETVEQAIKREIYEEVSIKVKNCRYFGSQSWPFPSQLMLGFHAEYDSGVIKPDGKEIDLADWFNFKSLPQVPPGRISISGRLIESYVDGLIKKELPGFT